MERRSTGSGERERGWQRGLTWALNHAPRNPPSTGSWQPRCHHGQATSYASWQHWSRISQSIRCKLALFKDDNEHQDTCRCHWRDAIMIGCPSHRAPLGLMVFRPGMGGRREQGGEQGWTGRKFSVVISLFHLCVLVSVGPCGQRGGHLHRVQAATSFSCPLTDMLSSQPVSHTHTQLLYYLSNVFKAHAPFTQFEYTNTGHHYVLYFYVSWCHMQ